ncbi:MAG: hypothetical protein HUK08_02650 [Bacteroidaceae bacterium]|nr:hypothetical protein [Bacteroidaceae bacterium]
MKKTLLSLVSALVVLSVVSCKKGAELREDGTVPEIPEKVAIEAVGLFSEINTSIDSLMKALADNPMMDGMDVQVKANSHVSTMGGKRQMSSSSQPLDRGRRQLNNVHTDLQMKNPALVGPKKITVPAGFFVPLEYADRSGSAAEQVELLGMYFADTECDKTYFDADNKQADRRKAQLKIITALNLNFPIEELDSICRLNSLEFGYAMRDKQLELFEEMIETNDAGLMLLFSIYYNAETTCNMVNAKKALTPTANVIAMTAMQTFKQKEIIKKTCRLYDMMLPYYDKLKRADKIMQLAKSLAEAKNEAQEKVAVTNYVRGCREIRTEMLAKYETDK